MTQSNTFNYKAKKKKTQPFVLNFASLWQDIACWIVPSKDLYMDKPEIIRDLIKVVPMIILGIVVLQFSLFISIEFEARTH